MLSQSKYRIVALLLSLVLCGCSIYSDTEETPVVGAESKVQLNIGVSLTDGAPFIGMQSRGELADAVGDGEKMQTLRIIIVRPDGTVEHNRYYDFHQAPTTYFATAKFEVVGGETKRVYLFANEHTTFATGHKVANYDFTSIKAGKAFPAEEINAALIEVNDSTTEIPLPLFMSESHSVEVPANEDKSVELIIVRAAVKFTFRLINNSAEPLSLSKLTISKLARKEYLLPNGVVYDTELSEEDNTTSITYIKEYKVPMVNNNDHYIYEKLFSGQSVPATTTTGRGELLLAPIYLLESNYDDEATSNKLNYNISLTIGDETYEKGYFDNLDALPRNTHVVVDVQLNSELKELDCSVRVYPYGEYWLYPEFGQ